MTTALPAHLGSVRAARRFVWSVLEPHRFGDAVVDAAVLAVSELAANAALHGGGDAMRIHIRCDGPRVRIEVDDPADTVPVLSGLPWSGLGLLERLTAGWGVEQTGSGKRVWCEVVPAPAATP